MKVSSNWNDGSENDWMNGFVVAWRLRVLEDLTWDMVTSTMVLARADVEPSMTKGLVIREGVELLISVN